MEEKKYLDDALEEIEGAKHYAKCALKHRESDPIKGKKFFDMATEELRHADTLYGMAGSGKAERTPLEKEFFDDLREEYAERCAKVKAMLEIYRGQ